MQWSARVSASSADCMPDASQRTGAAAPTRPFGFCRRSGGTEQPICINSTRPGMHRQQEAVRYTVVSSTTVPNYRSRGPSRAPPVGRLERNVAHVSEAFTCTAGGRPVSQTNDVGGSAADRLRSPGPPGWGAAATARPIAFGVLSLRDQPAGRPAPERLSSGQWSALRQPWWTTPATRTPRAEMPRGSEPAGH